MRCELLFQRIEVALEGAVDPVLVAAAQCDEESVGRPSVAHVLLNVVRYGLVFGIPQFASVPALQPAAYVGLPRKLRSVCYVAQGTREETGQTHIVVTERPFHFSTGRCITKVRGMKRCDCLPLS